MQANSNKYDKGKGKFASLNINNVYKGKATDSQPKQAVRQYGMQLLGKVHSSRRMPPPAWVPSLKSETGGLDPRVNLVPPGSSGWGGPNGEQPGPQPSGSTGSHGCEEGAKVSAGIVDTKGPVTSQPGSWTRAANAGTEQPPPPVIQRHFTQDFPKLRTESSVGSFGATSAGNTVGLAANPNQMSLRPQTTMSNWRERRQFQTSASPEPALSSCSTPDSPTDISRPGPMSGQPPTAPFMSSTATRSPGHSFTGTRPTSGQLFNTQNVASSMVKKVKGDIAATGWAAIEDEPNFDEKIVFSDEEDEENKPFDAAGGCAPIQRSQSQQSQDSLSHRDRPIGTALREREPPSLSGKSDREDVMEKPKSSRSPGMPGTRPREAWTGPVTSGGLQFMGYGPPPAFFDYRNRPSPPRPMMPPFYPGVPRMPVPGSGISGEAPSDSQERWMGEQRNARNQEYLSAVERARKKKMEDERNLMSSHDSNSPCPAESPAVSRSTDEDSGNVASGTPSLQSESSLNMVHPMQMAAPPHLASMHPHPYAGMPPHPRFTPPWPGSYPHGMPPHPGMYSPQVYTDPKLWEKWVEFLQQNGQEEPKKQSEEENKSMDDKKVPTQIEQKDPFADEDDDESDKHASHLQSSVSDLKRDTHVTSVRSTSTPSSTEQASPVEPPRINRRDPNAFSRRPGGSQQYGAEYSDRVVGDSTRRDEWKGERRTRDDWGDRQKDVRRHNRTEDTGGENKRDGRRGEWRDERYNYDKREGRRDDRHRGSYHRGPIKGPAPVTKALLDDPVAPTFTTLGRSRGSGNREVPSATSVESDNHATRNPTSSSWVRPDSQESAPVGQSQTVAPPSSGQHWQDTKEVETASQQQQAAVAVWEHDEFSTEIPASDSHTRQEGKRSGVREYHRGGRPRGVRTAPGSHAGGSGTGSTRGSRGRAYGRSGNYYPHGRNTQEYPSGKSRSRGSHSDRRGGGRGHDSYQDDGYQDDWQTSHRKEIQTRESKRGDERAHKSQENLGQKSSKQTVKEVESQPTTSSKQSSEDVLLPSQMVLEPAPPPSVNVWHTKHSLIAKQDSASSELRSDTEQNIKAECDAKTDEEAVPAISGKPSESGARRGGDRERRNVNTSRRGRRGNQGGRKDWTRDDTRGAHSRRQENTYMTGDGMWSYDYFEAPPQQGRSNGGDRRGMRRGRDNRAPPVKGTGSRTGGRSQQLYSEEVPVAPRHRGGDRNVTSSTGRDRGHQTSVPKESTSDGNDHEEWATASEGSDMTPGHQRPTSANETTRHRRNSETSGGGRRGGSSNGPSAGGNSKSSATSLQQRGGSNNNCSTSGPPPKEESAITEKRRQFPTHIDLNNIANVVDVENLPDVTEEEELLYDNTEEFQEVLSKTAKKNRRIEEQKRLEQQEKEATARQRRSREGRTGKTAPGRVTKTSRKGTHHAEEDASRHSTLAPRLAKQSVGVKLGKRPAGSQLRDQQVAKAMILTASTTSAATRQAPAQPSVTMSTTIELTQAGLKIDSWDNRLADGITRQGTSAPNTAVKPSEKKDYAAYVKGSDAKDFNSHSSEKNESKDGISALPKPIGTPASSADVYGPIMTTAVSATPITKTVTSTSAVEKDCFSRDSGTETGEAGSSNRSSPKGVNGKSVQPPTSSALQQGTTNRVPSSCPMDLLEKRSGINSSGLQPVSSSQAATPPSSLSIASYTSVEKLEDEIELPFYQPLDENDEVYKAEEDKPDAHRDSAVGTGERSPSDNTSQQNLDSKINSVKNLWYPSSSNVCTEGVSVPEISRRDSGETVTSVVSNSAVVASFSSEIASNVSVAGCQTSNVCKVKPQLQKQQQQQSQSRTDPEESISPVEHQNISLGVPLSSSRNASSQLFSGSTSMFPSHIQPPQHRTGQFVQLEHQFSGGAFSQQYLQPTQQQQQPVPHHDFLLGHTFHPHEPLMNQSCSARWQLGTNNTGSLSNTFNMFQSQRPASSHPLGKAPNQTIQTPGPVGSHLASTKFTYPGGLFGSTASNPVPPHDMTQQTVQQQHYALVSGTEGGQSAASHQHSVSPQLFTLIQRQASMGSTGPAPPGPNVGHMPTHSGFMQPGSLKPSSGHQTMQLNQTGTFPPGLMPPFSSAALSLNALGSGGHGLQSMPGPMGLKAVQAQRPNSQQQTPNFSNPHPHPQATYPGFHGAGGSIHPPPPPSNFNFPPPGKQLPPSMPPTSHHTHHMQARGFDAVLENSQMLNLASNAGNTGGGDLGGMFARGGGIVTNFPLPTARHPPPPTSSTNAGFRYNIMSHNPPVQQQQPPVVTRHQDVRLSDVPVVVSRHSTQHHHQQARGPVSSTSHRPSQPVSCAASNSYTTSAISSSTGNQSRRDMPSSKTGPASNSRGGGGQGRSQQRVPTTQGNAGVGGDSQSSSQRASTFGYENTQLTNQTAESLGGVGPAEFQRMIMQMRRGPVAAPQPRSAGGTSKSRGGSRRPQHSARGTGFTSPKEQRRGHQSSSSVSTPSTPPTEQLPDSQSEADISTGGVSQHESKTPASSIAHSADS